MYSTNIFLLKSIYDIVERVDIDVDIPYIPPSGSSKLTAEVSDTIHENSVEIPQTTETTETTETETPEPSGSSKLGGGVVDVVHENSVDIPSGIMSSMFLWL